MMEVVAHVRTKVLPSFDSGPKECLLELRKWNNILTFKKGSEEVKEVRAKLSEHWPTLFAIFQRWLEEVSALGAETGGIREEVARGTDRRAKYPGADV
jgi:hypothetical protein